MDIEQRIANAVAGKDNAALQALADEGWLMNEAPKGAATIKIPNSELVITEHGANDVTYSATVPFSAVETDNGVVHIAIAGRDVYIWSE